MVPSLAQRKNTKYRQATNSNYHRNLTIKEYFKSGGKIPRKILKPYILLYSSKNFRLLIEISQLNLHFRQASCL